MHIVVNIHIDSNEYKICTFLTNSYQKENPWLQTTGYAIFANINFFKQ